MDDVAGVDLRVAQRALKLHSPASEATDVSTASNSARTRAPGRSDCMVSAEDTVVDAPQTRQLMDPVLKILDSVAEPNDWAASERPTRPSAYGLRKPRD